MRSELVKLRALLPGESTLVPLTAAITGIYAGLAAGLFANTIHLFHLVFFRTSLLASAFAGDGAAAWRARVATQLTRAPWHLEYLLVGACGIAISMALDRIALRRSGGAVDRPFRTIARLLGAGLLLFYPLTALAAFNRSFPSASAGIASDAPWFVILLVPAAGGLVVGLIVHHLSPESAGHGVAEVIEAVAEREGRIPTSVGIFKSLTAAITIGSGGSVGREGPVVQIGSAVGSALGRHLGFTPANVVVLVGAGAAAGIAASFNAPIAGAMFALEIILLDFRVTAFAPIVLASVTSVLTARSLLGEVQEIVRPAYELVSPLEILAYALLGLSAGAAAHLYVRALQKSEAFFSGEAGIPLDRWMRSIPFPGRVALGGLMLGALGLLVPRVLGTGYETMNAALLGQLGGATLLVLLASKIVATSLTLGSGGSGGSFFPAMFLGAMLGGALGTAIHALFPAMTATPGAYALVGMGAVVAGATLGPLTGIVIMFELTGNYEIVLPLMVACGIASTFTHRSLGGSMYTWRLRKRGVPLRPPHERGLLRGLRVGSAMTTSVVTVPESLRLGDLMEIMGSSTYDTFPVVDAAGRLSGLLSVDELRSLLYDRDLSDVVVIKEVARPVPAVTFADEDLETALRRLGESEAHLLPVVRREEPDRIVGVLSRRDILRALGPASRTG